MPQWKKKNGCLEKCGDVPNPSHLRLIEVILQFWVVQLLLIYLKNTQRKKASHGEQVGFQNTTASFISELWDLGALSQMYLKTWFLFATYQLSYSSLLHRRSGKGTDRKWHVEPWLWLPSRISVMKMFLSKPWITLFQIWKGPPHPFKVFS